MTSKEEIRKMLRQKGSVDSAEASAVIKCLKAHPRVQRARTLLIYSALPDEVPTQQLIEDFLQKGKIILLPRVISNTEMELRRYTGDADLRQGAFGIMEPLGEVFTDYNQIDVAVIPGVAFDKEGHRLGRGRGYYDRFLPLLANTYKIGVCYPFRLQEHIPTDEHDIQMDEVIY